MRLIDLDKIDVFHQEDEDIVFDIIHATPVDAIPIEWIEHWKFTEPKYWEIVNGNDEIGRMLDDWRKDNEID